MHDVFDPLHFNCAAGIYRQARSRSSRQEYSKIFLLWKSCKITKYFVLFIQCYYFEDMIVYSYLPKRGIGWPEVSGYISATMHCLLEGWSFYYLSVVYLVSARFSFNWNSSSAFLGFCCKLYKIIVFYLQVNYNMSNYVAFLVFSGKAGLVAPLS